MVKLIPYFFVFFFLGMIFDAIIKLRKKEIEAESFQKFKIIIGLLLAFVFSRVVNEFATSETDNFFEVLSGFFFFSCPVMFIIGLIIVIAFKQKIKIGLSLLILSAISFIVGLNTICGGGIF